MTDIGIAGWGTAFPRAIRTSNDLARLTGLPAGVIREEFGVHQIYVAGPDEPPAALAAAAARNALGMAGIRPAEVDMVIYHGSAYTDYPFWSIAAHIQHLLSAERAAAFEIGVTGGSTGIALAALSSMMANDPRLRHVLLVAASHDVDLADYADPHTHFLIGLSAGAGALLLRRDQDENCLIGTAILTDGSLNEEIVVLAAGARQPSSAKTVRAGQRVLDVPDPDSLRHHLDQVSLSAFVQVIRQAVERGGRSSADIAFLAVNHTKASFHASLLAELGLRPEQSVYLSDFGHVHAADQVIALEQGLRQGRIRPGDLVVLAGVGVGCTWSAAAIEWGPKPRLAMPSRLTQAGQSRRSAPAINITL